MGIFLDDTEQLDEFERNSKISDMYADLAKQLDNVDIKVCMKTKWFFTC